MRFIDSEDQGRGVGGDRGESIQFQKVRYNIVRLRIMADSFRAFTGSKINYTSSMFLRYRGWCAAV